MDSRLATSGMTAVRSAADYGKAMDSRLTTSGMTVVRSAADYRKAMDSQLEALGMTVGAVGMMSYCKQYRLYKYESFCC
jgi:hypothetical protein